MKKKMIAALLGSALMLTALSGCGQNTDGGNAVQKNEITAEAGNTGKDELVFVNYRDIRDLNPHLYAGEMYAQSILYDTLVSSAEDGRLVRTGVHIPLISGTVCIFPMGHSVMPMRCWRISMQSLKIRSAIPGWK